MIISPGRNYVFVHIPKTGGTSLALALETRARADDILIGDTPKALRRRARLRNAQAAGRLWKHSTLADIEGLVSRDFIAGALCVTLVRNPWDRLVSLYHWAREQRFDNPVVHAAREHDFAGFLNAPQTQSALRANPYEHYLKDSRGQPHEALYIRLERLNPEAEPLWDHLGFRLSLPHANRSGRDRPYHSVYDGDLAELAGRLCAEDIARFGYRFGG